MRTTRRQLLTAAAAAHTLASIVGAAPAKSRPPNIVFIMADDLGYADLSCYGRRDYATPHIDRLAHEGMRFTQAYANSSVCSASRTALITGRYQYRLRVGLEEPIALNGANVGIPPDHPTLPSLLRKAGYETTLIGKFHLGRLPEYSPLKIGYDHFWGYHSGGIDYFTHKLAAGPKAADDLWEGDTPVHEAGYMTDLIGNHAVASIKNARRPYFLSVHFSAPHWPWEGPEDEAESRRIQTLADHDGGSAATYAKMVRRLDMQVGRILDAVNSSKEAGNTIVIFTSDNGGERFSDVWPFSGRKSELLEGGLRIPAIVRWPGRVPKGVSSSQVMISMDWLPTLLDAAGTKPDAAFPSDGMSLMPVLTANAAPVPRKLFWRYRYNAQRALRDGDLKYLEIAGNTYLFNVVEDPLEKANRKAREPEVFRRLAAEYEAWNQTMLPEDPKAYTYFFSAAEMADRPGNKP